MQLSSSKFSVALCCVQYGKQGRGRRQARRYLGSHREGGTLAGWQGGTFAGRQADGQNLGKQAPWGIYGRQAGTLSRRQEGTLVGRHLGMKTGRRDIVVQSKSG